MIKLEFRERADGVWKEISAERIAGMTVREILEFADGKDIVVKFDADGRKGFIVGTNELYFKYQDRGELVFVVLDALTGIGAGENAPVLEEVVVPEVFTGGGFDGGVAEYCFDPSDNMTDSATSCDSK